MAGKAGSGEPLRRAQAFCDTFGLRVPVLMAPMAGACPVALAAAVGNAGGMGGCGALLMGPDAIREWAGQYRGATNAGLNLNIWIPDPEPVRDAAQEASVAKFLGRWGPAVEPAAGDARPLDFEAQCEAMLEAGPAVISSIMGLFPPAYVARMKERSIKWFAGATTVEEALQAEAAGADVIVAQGMEAGGHRGAFIAENAARDLVGLFALLPAVADAVEVPVAGAGGISDGRTVAAALMLGASAVMVGTGLLRSPEAGLPSAWADAIGGSRPEGTVATRAFSGRLGRSIKTAYADAAGGPDAPEPAPYPVQRGLTQAMRTQAARDNSLDGMQAWAGQSSRLAQARPAAEIVAGLWEDAQALLG
ncbi:MAG TPA: nitronate monooxygenase [Hyphomicrobiaceae bacterium]|nr:nitronate monooxygenase [Hyphomicrobiaceae bacterium]